MYLVWIGLALVVLKLVDFKYIGEWPWWWVLTPLALALVWFEFFERRLGLDKKRAHDEYEATRQKRIKQALSRDGKRP